MAAMQRTDFSAMHCSIARTLAVAGEPWSPLVVRDVYIGINRFDDLQRDLGISRKVLAERLRHLVDAGCTRILPYALPCLMQSPPVIDPLHNAFNFHLVRLRDRLALEMVGKGGSP